MLRGLLDRFDRLRREERGSAVVEFLGVTLVLLLPLVYLVLTLGQIQAAAFAAEAAARESGRVLSHEADLPTAAARAQTAVELAFGDHARNLVVNSTKSMTGHLLGAAGGIEAVFTTLAVYNQVSPPTINIFNQDPECDLDYCANEARQMKIDVGLSNSFGFGGTIGSMAVRRV